jgi:hypothetical protein
MGGGHAHALTHRETAWSGCPERVCTTTEARTCWNHILGGLLRSSRRQLHPGTLLAMAKAKIRRLMSLLCLAPLYVCVPDTHPSTLNATLRAKQVRRESQIRLKEKRK